MEFLSEETDDLCRTESECKWVTCKFDRWFWPATKWHHALNKLSLDRHLTTKTPEPISKVQRGWPMSRRITVTPGTSWSTTSSCFHPQVISLTDPPVGGRTFPNLPVNLMILRYKVRAQVNSRTLWHLIYLIAVFRFMDLDQQWLVWVPQLVLAWSDCWTLDCWWSIFFRTAWLHPVYRVTLH